MKAVVLAAGYATRLYPVTLATPKPLLEVAGKPMINYVMDNLAPIPGIDRMYVVTNARFADQFLSWAGLYRKTMPELNFSVINDGTTNERDKLGAIGDLRLVMEREQIDDDLIVIAADNLLSENLGSFGAFCCAKNSPVLAVYDVGSLELASQYNAIRLDQDGRILHFEEKPQRPEGTLVAIALYYYPKHTLPLIHQYVAEGNNPDQPGRLPEWLHTRIPFYSWQVQGTWYDIGSRETLELANRHFSQRP
jgi:glucose-1-phosphate thymidylyltransferase